MGTNKLCPAICKQTSTGLNGGQYSPAPGNGVCFGGISINKNQWRIIEIFAVNLLTPEDDDSGPEAKV